MGGGRSKSRVTVGAISPVAPLELRVVARIAAAAAAMQGVAWLVLYGLFGVARIGYAFFDVSDIGAIYYPYALNLSRGYAAYRDFFIEYPPLFVPLLRALGNPGAQAEFVVRFAAVMIGCMIAAGAVTAIASVDGRSTRRPYVVGAVFAALVLLLGPITANRYDALVALVLAVTLLLAMRGHWELGAVALGIGFALKITPALMLPIILILAPPRRAARSLAAFAVVAVIPFAWVLALGGQSSARLGEMASYHLGRPLEIESVLAMPLWVGRLAGSPLNIQSAAGSQVIVSRAAVALASGSVLVLLASLGATTWLVWRRRATILADPRLIALASLATLLASLVGSKVFSPQYFVWIIPAVALVAVDRRLLGSILAGAILLTHVFFPANYFAFAWGQQSGPIVLVVVRNLLVVAAFGLSLRYLWALPEAKDARKHQ